MHSADVLIRQVPPLELRQYWHAVKPGLEEAAGYSKDEWIVEDAYAAIQRGEMSLYFCTVDRAYAGSMLLMKRQDWKGPVLHIFSLFVLPQYGRYIDAHMQYVDDLAKQHGCSRITFQSPRQGWERRAARLGFEPKTVIYSKEV